MRRPVAPEAAAFRAARRLASYMIQRFGREPLARVWFDIRHSPFSFSLHSRDGTADAHLVLTADDLLRAIENPALITEAVDALELRWRQARFYRAIYARGEVARFKRCLGRVQP